MDSAEQKIIEKIDASAERIIAFAEDIFRSAEPGFREVRTAGKVAELFRGLNLPTEQSLAVTGVRASLNGGASERIVLIGELDGIRCESHPCANPENHISHACGHNAQLAALTGAAIALSDPQVAQSLGGGVDFLAVPAEEYVDRTVRAELIREGKVKYGIGGKSELIRMGVFDGVDAVITHHVHYFSTPKDVLLGSNSSNGFVSKTIRIHGKAAHAGSAPWDGVNALNAAALGLSALAYTRETFRDFDHVRVHPIMTRGGDVVNAVPAEAVIEMMVRAKSLDAIQDANRKTTRAFQGGALALGAEAEIEDTPGYLPVIAQKAPPALLQAAGLLAGEAEIGEVDLAQHNALSTDVGDLSHLLPVVNFTTGGFRGGLHQADFTITDPYKAYIVPAKLMALTAYRLLQNGGAAARALKEDYRPVLTKSQYLDYLSGKAFS